MCQFLFFTAISWLLSTLISNSKQQKEELKTPTKTLKGEKKYNLFWFIDIKVQKYMQSKFKTGVMTAWILMTRKRIELQSIVLESI